LPPFDAGVGHRSSEPGVGHGSSEAGAGRGSPEAGAVQASDVVNDAVRIRALAARERGERVLRRLGVRVAPRIVSRRRASFVQKEVDGGEQRRRTSG
jgi:hypothetical protein